MNIWTIWKNSMNLHYLIISLEDFYNKLNMEDITVADYADGKKVCKDFKMKSLGKYHDLHVQSDTLLLADAFENFRNMCL